LKPFPDDNVRLTNLRTGDADVMLGNPPFRTIAELKRDQTVVVQELVGLGFMALMLNTQREPFNEPAVRRALSWAIDRSQIAKTVFHDSGQVLDTPVPQAVPWAYEPDTHPYLKRDLARARQELAKANKSGQIPFTLQISNRSTETLQVAELIKDQVKDAGLELKISALDFGTVLENGRQGEFQSVALGFTGSLDPDGNLYTVVHSQSAQNLSRYENAQVDQLLEEARATVDQSRRSVLYKQLQRILLDDQPFVVYYNPPQICVYRKVVQNYPQTYNGHWGSRDFERIWKSA
jgi:peptide/nickel transport system substrate-binding protein